MSKIKQSWWVDFRFHGVRYRERSPLNTRAGAKEYELTLRARLARGEPIDGPSPSAGDMTFAQFAERWFRTYAESNNKLSEQSTKEMILRRHLLPWFGKKRLTDIGNHDIEAYKAAKLAPGDLSRKTINNQLAVLGKALSSAVEWSLIQARPRVKLLRTVSNRTDFLSPLESAALLRDSAEPLWNTMARAALRTGMRPNELTALKWMAVDFERNTIDVRASMWHGHLDSPKNNRARQLPMTADLRAALLDLPRHGEFVFCQESGAPLTDTMRKKPLWRICERAGIRRITWYTFRHTFATRLADEGVPAHVIKELMGHASITTTMRYMHVAPSALKDVLKVLVQAEEREVSKTFGQPVPNLNHLNVRESLEMMAA